MSGVRVDRQDKGQALRLALLVDEWEQSGNRVRARCARDVRRSLEADDVLGAFVAVLDTGKHRTELDELRALIRVVETLDLGGYTQRDADAVAVALWTAGYRRTQDN